MAFSRKICENDYPFCYSVISFGLFYFLGFSGYYGRVILSLGLPKP